MESIRRLFSMAKIELITRTEQRRRWSEGEKRWIVPEAGGPGTVVSEVARRHQVAGSCIYAWRRRFDDPGSVPVLIAASGAAAPGREREGRAPRYRAPLSASARSLPTLASRARVCSASVRSSLARA